MTQRNKISFLDYFRPRLYNPQTGESWIQRPSPGDVFFAYAAAAGAVLFFLVMSLAIVAHANKKQAAPAAKIQLKVAPHGLRIHPKSQSLAEHNAHMFDGSQRALDQLGQFPGEPPSPPAQRKPKTNDSNR